MPSRPPSSASIPYPAKTRHIKSSLVEYRESVVQKALAGEFARPSVNTDFQRHKIIQAGIQAFDIS